MGVQEIMKRIPRSDLQSKGLAYSVYLLDGRSTDQTRAVGARLGAEVFIQSGSGKGSAFREFVPRITEDLTMFMDPDGTYPPEAIPDLVDVLTKDSPVVVGSRFLGSIDEGAMSTANFLGNRLLSWFASVLFATPISDVCSGMWGFMSDRLKSLGLTATGFELEADIFAECALRHIPIVELPIQYHRRIGERKLRMRAGIRIALALLKKRLRAPSGPGIEESTRHARWFGRAEGS
jgi:dolichol-phosphate mannosyltransferase